MNAWIAKDAADAEKLFNDEGEDSMFLAGKIGNLQNNGVEFDVKWFTFQMLSGVQPEADEVANRLAVGDGENEGDYDDEAGEIDEGDEDDLDIVNDDEEEAQNLDNLNDTVNDDDDEEEQTYCICRGPAYDPMLACDACDEWYHKSCLLTFGFLTAWGWRKMLLPEASGMVRNAASN